MAAKNKMDLSIAVALGSSTQARPSRRPGCGWGGAAWGGEGGGRADVLGLEWTNGWPCKQSGPQLPAALATRPPHELTPPVALPCTQVAIFIVPLVVLIGWAMGAPFTLDFDPFCVLLLLGERTGLGTRGGAAWRGAALGW